jgi:hypothetical protein
MDPIATTELLTPGTVVQIAVQLRDKQDGSLFWWRRFACVLPHTWGGGQMIRRHKFMALTLKMRPTNLDIREIDLRTDKQVVVIVPDEKLPQGVIAMRMKLIHQGLIQLGDEP